ncbi:MAG: PIG-L family deacetylase [Patescibacteria group bacterium]|jgi:LmbE family N-acetylglucosaminyl deacetylase
MQKYEVLVFCAHPDDAERHMGGTLAHLARSGRQVLMISLTSGEMGTHGDSVTRKQEFQASAKVLGVDGLLMHFMDTGVENTRTGQLEIARLMRAHQPSVVFAPFPVCGSILHGVSAHTDHYTTGELVTQSILLAKLAKVDATPPHRVEHLLYYMLPPDVAPNVLIGISDEDLRVGMQAIACHESQLASYTGDVPLAEYLTSVRRVQCRQYGVRLPNGCHVAEGFLHLGPLVLRGNSLNVLFGKV